VARGALTLRPRAAAARAQRAREPEGGVAGRAGPQGGGRGRGRSRLALQCLDVLWGHKRIHHIAAWAFRQKNAQLQPPRLAFQRALVRAMPRDSVRCRARETHLGNDHTPRVVGVSNYPLCSLAEQLRMTA